MNHPWTVSGSVEDMLVWNSYSVPTFHLDLSRSGALQRLVDRSLLYNAFLSKGEMRFFRCRALAGRERCSFDRSRKRWTSPTRDDLYGPLSSFCDGEHAYACAVRARTNSNYALRRDLSQADKQRTKRTRMDANRNITPHLSIFVARPRE